MKLNNSLTKQLLVLLLLTDGLFLLLHFFQAFTPFVSNSMFNVETDRGYPEFFQYIKYFWSALVFVYLGLAQSKAYWSWSLLFFYLLLDDSLEGHEKMGRFLAERLSFSGGMLLRAVDYGEILYSLFVAIIFFTVIALAYQRGRLIFRQFSRKMFGLFAGLALFAVVADMIHVMTGHLPGPFSDLMGMVEDGGEMIMMSFIFCYSFSHLSVIESRNSLQKQSYFRIKENFFEPHDG